METIDSLSRFYKYLTDRKPSAIRKLFTGPIAINTPLSGAVDGESGLTDMLNNEGSWMRQHLISVEPVSQIRNERRVAVELKLVVKINGRKTNLPVILIGDLCGSSFGQIRIYHSTWPINGEHSYRAPIVWPRAEQNEPQIMKVYLKGLTRGEPDRILNLFTEEATIQEPSGTGFIHRGKEERESFFRRALAGGPIGIYHAVVIQSENFFCVEYICESWGEMLFRPMAGCTVYEFTDDMEKMTAIRVYDDVTVPGEQEYEIPPLD